ncbi:MipA/OmpV family protein [Candidatus Thiodiazotropha sp. CDECU1]|uniref:MipA/OmpV family protein n=1 Tax=Candidatus Thiodiazotropha sp. CDECU1 TaxID=3065865 RepID=UPI00292FAC0F|nr:MipA/OmpV family protein [Candidatus Thiodiazotropha sp. CDECU1]
MVQRLKFYTGLIGLIGVAIHTPSLAERSVQAGLVTSANSSFYEDAGNEYYFLPLVIAEYDRFYLQGISGGYRFYQDDGGQSLALEIRRTFDGYSSDDSDALEGMADRDAAWEAGLAYEVGIAGGQAKAKLMQDISDTHKGLSVRVEYERPFWTNDTHMLSWYAGSEYWNGKKTDYYFGVSPEEATAATRHDYTADESYRFYLGSNLVKRIDDNISLLASAEYLRADDAVDDSPLTTRQDQWSAYIGVFYEF